MKLKSKVTKLMEIICVLIIICVFVFVNKIDTYSILNNIFNNLQVDEASTQDTDETEVTVTTFDDIDDLILNPNKGYVGSVWEGLTSPLSDKYWDVIVAGYRRFDFVNIAPSEGFYNWDYINNWKDKYIEKGKKYAFGVMYISTTALTEYITPKWVFDKMTDSEKTIYINESTNRIYHIPRYDSPVFINEVMKFNEACADYFKNDDNLLYMDIRVYGDWGENVYSRFEGAEATEEELVELYLEPIVQIYKDTNINLLFNYGNEMKNVAGPYLTSNGVGMRRDSFLGSWFKKTYNITNEKVKDVPLTFEMLKKYSTLLESEYNNDEEAFKKDYEKYIKLTGASYMEFFSDMYDSDPEFYNRMANLLGYWFRFKKATYKVGTKDNITTLNGTFEFKNDGVSSLYNNADVYIGIFDQNDNLVKKVKTDINPKDWKAKEWTEDNLTEENTIVYTENVNLTIGKLDDGNYKLALGIFEEGDTTEPAYKFGSAGSYNGNWYLFGSTQINNSQLISPKVVSDIRIIYPIKDTYIKGEKLDLTGGILEVIYEDDTTSQISLSSSEVRITGYNSNQLGEQIIKIEYQGKITSFRVTVNSKIINVESIVLNKKVITLEEGENSTLVASMIPENTTSKVVIWSSSNEEIATVDNNGNIKAIKAGETTITATIDGKTASCTVTVIKEPIKNKIQIIPASATINIGIKKQLLIDNDEYKDKLTWKSSNDDIVTVDKTGIIEGISIGKVTITVETNDSLIATSQISVVPLIESSTTKITLLEGDSKLIDIKVNPSNIKLTWISSNPDIAKVDSKGKVTAVKEGTTSIIVNADSEVNYVWNVEVKNNKETPKRKSNILVYILIVAISALLVGIVFLFIKKKRKS